MQRRPPSKLKAEPDNKNRQRIIIAVVILLLLSATGAWAMWNREDPQMAKVRADGRPDGEPSPGPAPAAV